MVRKFRAPLLLPPVIKESVSLPFKWSRQLILGHCSFLKFPCFLASLLSCLQFPLSSSFVSSRYSFSLTMSSFLFDSFIGMDDGDSRGSIEQPMINQEVISIGSSLSKDTRCGASDNEFFSLERVRALCHTCRVTFCPCGRVRPSAIVGEPVPVTVILISYAFGV